MVKDLLEDSILTPEEQKVARSKVMLDIKQHRQQAAALATNELIQAATQQAVDTSWWQQLAQSDHSVLKWLQGILTDLGIGFGWAVLYFTLFISWNGGKTIGKALMSIKVVQLNNMPLSIWQELGAKAVMGQALLQDCLAFYRYTGIPTAKRYKIKLPIL